MSALRNAVVMGLLLVVAMPGFGAETGTSEASPAQVALVDVDGLLEKGEVVAATLGYVGLMDSYPTDPSVIDAYYKLDDITVLIDEGKIAGEALEVFMAALPTLSEMKTPLGAYAVKEFYVMEAKRLAKAGRDVEALALREKVIAEALSTLLLPGDTSAVFHMASAALRVSKHAGSENVSATEKKLEGYLEKTQPSVATHFVRVALNKHYAKIGDFEALNRHYEVIVEEKKQAHIKAAWADPSIMPDINS